MVDNRNEEEKRGQACFHIEHSNKDPTGYLLYFRLISVFLKVFTELPVLQESLMKD